MAVITRESQYGPLVAGCQNGSRPERETMGVRSLSAVRQSLPRADGKAEKRTSTAAILASVERRIRRKSTGHPSSGTAAVRYSNERVHWQQRPTLQSGRYRLAALRSITPRQLWLRRGGLFLYDRLLDRFLILVMRGTTIGHGRAPFLVRGDGN